MSIYVSHPKAKGNVTKDPHKEWFECDSIAFDASCEANTDQGHASQRQGKGVSIGEITLTKPVCPASPDLFQQSTAFATGEGVEIHLTRIGNGKEVSLLEMKLDKCCVTNYTVDTDGTNHSENIALNFTAITMKYFPPQPDGSAGAPIPVCFDICKGKAVPV